MKTNLIMILLSFFIIHNSAIADNEISNNINKISANVIFLRHAIAPGFGDPDNFKLDDCSTQRNLSKEGIKQAKSIGKKFLNNKINFTKIFSSEWCRCQDTTKIMNIGTWETFSGLNSFYQGYVNKDITIKSLREKLSEIKSNDLVLMITHQVVISEITGISSPSGGMIAYNSYTKIAKKI